MTTKEHEAHGVSVTCPSCGTSISLDPRQQQALSSLVDAEARARVDDAMARAERGVEARVRAEVGAAVEVERARAAATLSAKEAELATARSSIELEVSRAVSAAQQEVLRLSGELERARLEAELAERAVRETLQARLDERDEQIERLRDMKLRMSTKMVGETLEQHCENEFERVRAMAFAGCSFEKDNDVVAGSKGDYVFRDPASGCSIMFEMKNETLDGTSAKHRNEEFFAKLDRDRRNKGCEHAVLVSMLEPESELYNAGIVDVSHRYEKMYVVRPQFFLPILSLIRDGARAGAAAREELAQVRSQELDVMRFEEDLDSFRAAFGKNYESSSRNLTASIEQIDKAIAALSRTRETLVTSERQMRLANDKAQGLTVRKLVRGNETMAEAFRATTQG